MAALVVGGDLYAYVGSDRRGRHVCITVGIVRGHWLCLLPCHWVRYRVSCSNEYDSDGGGSAHFDRVVRRCVLDGWKFGWGCRPNRITVVRDHLNGSSIHAFDITLTDAHDAQAPLRIKYSGCVRGECMAAPVGAAEGIDCGWPWTMYSLCAPQQREVDGLQFGTPERTRFGVL